MFSVCRPRAGIPSKRKEILHNIDVLFPWKGERLFNNTFDTRVRAAIRVGDFKLITGDPGVGKWFPVPSTNSETIASISSEESQPSNTEGRKNADVKNLWLFNIRTDPTERHDLSTDMPELVEDLLRRISGYNATALPPVYPPSDPKCDPKLHGGFWGPWR
ncbi:arylsulfatase b-like [Plakobranchus ocellatus]|uniref:Arylsulfatase b-like n=1 Tax=Plakobranchus ocellatus TaxID=259542 RepID=A0AAV4DMD0_9GAST|nr:arylsulfatase b-like [Plakobranchus ocellatus]